MQIVTVKYSSRFAFCSHFSSLAAAKWLPSLSRCYCISANGLLWERKKKFWSSLLYIWRSVTNCVVNHFLWNKSLKWWEKWITCLHFCIAFNLFSLSLSCFHRWFLLFVHLVGMSYESVQAACRETQHFSVLSGELKHVHVFCFTLVLARLKLFLLLID